MKNRLIKIILLATLVVMAGVFFAACDDSFNAAGSATVTLNFDKEYTGMNISCPSGKIEGSGSNYKVKLDTLSEVDIVVTCEGYYTQYLNYKTKDLREGDVIAAVSLKERDIIVKLSVANVADKSDVTFTSSGNLIKGTPEFDGKSTYRITLSDISDDQISIIKSGCITNTIDIKAGDFYDYTASYTAPLLNVGDKKAVITFAGNGNNSFNDYSQYNVSKYGYGNSYHITSGNVGNTDVSVYLDIDDYEIYTEGNETIYASKAELTAQPYIRVKASESSRYSTQVELRDAGDWLGTDIVLYLNGTRYEKMSMIINGNIPFQIYDRDIKSTNDVKFVVSKYGGELVALYTETLTHAQLMREWTAQTKIDKTLTATIDFVDENGNPFLGYTMGGDADNSLTYDAATGRVTIKVADFFAGNKSVSFYDADGNYEIHSIYRDNVFSGTIVVRENASAKVKLVDIDGNIANDVAEALDADGYCKPQAVVEGGGFSLELGNDYVRPSITFNRKIFTKGADGVYRYTLTVYKKKTCSFKLPAGLTNSNINSIMISATDGWGKSTNYPDRTVTMAEHEIGMSFRVSIYGENFNGNQTIKFTQEMFDEGVMDLSTVKINYYNNNGKY